MNKSVVFGVNEKVLTMELERNIRSIATNVHTSSPSISKSTPLQNESQGIATLLVMIAVLTIIIMFCCFSAPGIRGLCKKYIFRSCTCHNNEPDLDNVSTSTPETITRGTPTVILLPYGRMLVVDHTVFNQLQADQSGIDLLELSANLINHHQGSTPSILDSETSKGLSLVSLSHSPPAYDDIFFDLPPSYSEVSLMWQNTESIEMRTSNDVCINLNNRETDGVESV